MTVILFIVVLLALSGLVLVAGRLGVDSRPLDPGRRETEWPFARHGS
jgi:hypothetical protein